MAKMPFGVGSSLPNLQTSPLGVVSAFRENPAKWMYERLVRSIADFEKELKPNEEVGARLVSFGQREIISIADVGFWGPDLITFDGVNPDGHAVKLLQHISQISVLLVALPAEGRTPRWIGFDLERKLDQLSGEGA